MPDPRLTVSLLTPEEAPQYVRIRHEAFVNDINKILYFSGDASQKTLDRVTNDVRDLMNKGILFLKCVDASTGEIIACARWRYVRPKDPNVRGRTWEEVEEGLTIGEPYEESHPDVWKAFFALLNENKRQLMGTRPYYMLDTLVTHPNHHRRGAGGMLVAWGCEKADEAGVEMYLEASMMGQPLYARYKFKDVKPISLDLRRWGGNDEIQWMLMRRPAKTSETS